LLWWSIDVKYGWGWMMENGFALDYGKARSLLELRFGYGLLASIIPAMF
jgi:hypothetical protein